MDTKGGFLRIRSKRAGLRLCLLILSLMIFLYGCSSIGNSACVKRHAVNGIYPTLEDLLAAGLASDDTVILGNTLEAWLLVVDTLVKESPENRNLLVFACRLYAYYGFGWVIDEDPERGRKLYRKGIDYGMRALRMNEPFRKALDGNVLPEEAVKFLDPEKDLPAAFYTSLALGVLLISSLDVPEVLILGDTFKELALWAVDVDETFHNGAGHTLIGIYYGIMPGILGGGPDKSRRHFDRAIELDETLLLHYWGYARYYPTLTGDEEHFDRLLDHIRKTPSGINESVTALNEVVKQKARRLDEQRNHWF